MALVHRGPDADRLVAGLASLHWRRGRSFAPLCLCLCLYMIDWHLHLMRGLERRGAPRVVTRHHGCCWGEKSRGGWAARARSFRGSIRRGQVQLLCAPARRHENCVRRGAYVCGIYTGESIPYEEMAKN